MLMPGSHSWASLHLPLKQTSKPKGGSVVVPILHRRRQRFQEVDELTGWLRACLPNFRAQAPYTVLPGALLCGDCTEERALFQDALTCSTSGHLGKRAIWHLGCERLPAVTSEGLAHRKGLDGKEVAP